MMTQGKHILTKFTQRWKFFLALEVFLYALGAALLTYGLFSNSTISVGAFVVFGLIMLLIIQPWKPSLQQSASYVDTHLDAAEYSSSLLLNSTDNLSSIAKLQHQKIAEYLSSHIKNLQPPHHLIRGSITASLLILLGLLSYHFNFSDNFKSNNHIENTSNAIVFQPLDSLVTAYKPPKLTSQHVSINYPSYTNIATRTFTKMDVKAIEGSRLTWQLKFNTIVDSVFMESMGNSYPLTLRNDTYYRSSTLTNSGFYNFKFVDSLGQSFTSDLYAIEVIKDKTPIVKIKDLNQFTSYNYDDSKTFQLNSSITDDFGIADAFIIATVSKGSGESVKFREEKITFDTSISKGAKSLNLSKQLDLDTMKMEPGDELYFYIEASDLKQPKPNITRSETYFAVIKDTTSYEFGVEGTLGVDRMPDYFRSQRQLIIDTEKLIADKPSLTTKEFNFKSNELGYDQKALRLKYGEFMGVETEDVGGGINQESLESFEQEEEHSDEEHDPLAEYTHDHDGDNEHNLVEEDHDHDHHDEENDDDPLAEYTHNHEDSEMATLFEESLRGKLLRAMNEMWDAELYLRLYQPEKSLPYQYRALKLIQEIKNSARIYVHRIGFDPPPIKEDKRLTGKKLEDIKSYTKSETIDHEDDYLFMKKAVLQLERIINSEHKITKIDRQIFEYAGTELAELAIAYPGLHLKTLQNLKQLTVFGESSMALCIETQKGLLYAIPTERQNATKPKISIHEIDQLLLKALENND